MPAGLQYARPTDSINKDWTPYGIELIPFAVGLAGAGDNNLIIPAAGYKLRIYYMAYNPTQVQNIIYFRWPNQNVNFLMNTIVLPGSIIMKDLHGNYIEGLADEPFQLHLDTGTLTYANLLSVQVPG